VQGSIATVPMADDANLLLRVVHDLDQDKLKQQSDDRLALLLGGYCSIPECG
jgi:hypothetical protein